jgi:hypothetical protein
MPYSVAKRDFMADITIEGAQLAQAIGPTIEALLAQGKLDLPAALPLMTTMINIVTHDAPVVFPWDAFFAGETTWSRKGYQVERPGRQRCRPGGTTRTWARSWPRPWVPGRV